MEEHYPEILRRYMGEERDGRLGHHNKTTQDAADICGASQGTSAAAKGAEPVNREERERNLISAYAADRSLHVLYFRFLNQPGFLCC